MILHNSILCYVVKVPWRAMRVKLQILDLKRSFRTTMLSSACSPNQKLEAQRDEGTGP